MGFFGKYDDDWMFPRSGVGRKKYGIFESIEDDDWDDDEDDEDVDEDADDIEEAAGVASGSARSDAMSAVLGWIDGGDYSYDSLDEAIVAVSDLDGDDDISDSEEDYYNDVWQGAADAMLTLGASVEDVQDLVDGPDANADKAAARVGAQLSASMNGVEADDEDLIYGFAYGENAVMESAVGNDRLYGILEATYKKRKVVRDGKVKVVRKRVSGRIRLSAAQKAGLRKARRKAKTASAKIHRRKSMRLRQRRGLKTYKKH